MSDSIGDIQPGKERGECTHLNENGLFDSKVFFLSVLPMKDYPINVSATKTFELFMKMLLGY